MSPTKRTSAAVSSTGKVPRDTIRSVDRLRKQVMRLCREKVTAMRGGIGISDEEIADYASREYPAEVAYRNEAARVWDQMMRACEDAERLLATPAPAPALHPQSIVATAAAMRGLLGGGAPFHQEEPIDSVDLFLTDFDQPGEFHRGQLPTARELAYVALLAGLYWPTQGTRTLSSLTPQDIVKRAEAFIRKRRIAAATGPHDAVSRRYPQAQRRGPKPSERPRD